ncbi:MAG TPA: FMN-binding protein [Propionibacteriaceae bacterium]|nr:FMN-binding protein [Propionibacteriaceae bacterium]
MRRMVIWLASTITIVVLLFGYHTSTNRTSSAAAPSSASSPTSTAASNPTASPSTKITTYQGSVAQTRWGPVQVQITVRSGKITKVLILQQPNGNRRDAEINDQALPILINETVSAQSAEIDMVSGATVTSEGYLRSLQAALDEAGR